MDITVVLTIVIVVLLAAVLWLVVRKPSPDSSLLIKQDLTELGRTIESLKDNLHATVSDRLDKSQALMQGSMQKQLSESAKLIADVTQRIAKLDETNRQVVDVAAELKTLQNVLQNP